jgi:FtsP/CotA-like multicopper oxidase with cupredoxin domain
MNLAPVAPIDTAGAQKLKLQFGHGMPNMDGDIDFFAQMIDGKGVPYEQLTPEMALQASVGKTYVWEVVNMAMGDHNFHPHGFSFQPLEIEYTDMDNPENNRVIPFEVVEFKDTIRVPGRVGKKGRSKTIVRLAVTFDDAGREGQIEAFGKVPAPGHSGGWFVHCHFLEHAARGMGTFLNLRDDR